MIHRQQRRDPAESTPTAPSGASDRTPGEIPTETTEPPRAVVPQQERRPRRDAYDLYAQIYAIRTDDRTC